MNPNDHIHGASFTRTLPIPDLFGDGYFVGWVVTCQVREPSGKLVADAVCEWLNPATTRHLKVRVANTTGWPMGDLDIGIKFVRTSDGEVVKTTTATFAVVKGAAQ